MKIGIFGGTFNPIHIGHLRAAEEVRQRINLDKILFIPSGNPPLKSEGILPASVRLEMVQLAIRGNNGFEVSDIEVNDTERSFSVLTIQKLLAGYNAEMFFILGLDSFLELPLWHQPEKLLSMIDFIIMTRPGISLDKLFESRYVSGDNKQIISLKQENTLTINLNTGRHAIVVDISQLDISSTKIRSLIKSGKSIRYLVTDDVYNFILKHSLYN